MHPAQFRPAEFVHNDTNTKDKKTSKKPLTNGNESGIIYRLSERGAPRMKGSEKNLEKVQKTFGKVLDKSKSLWYNIKVAERRPTARPKPFKKTLKKVKKLLKKYLTNGKVCGIIYKLSHQKARLRLIIEN